MASTRNAGASAGSARASTTAAAKLVAAWPDGKAAVDGVVTSTSIPSNVSSGRRRSVASFRPDAARSASSTTAGTANAMLGRRSQTATATPSAIHSRPCVPAYVRPTKSGSSQSTRCSTIHRSTRSSSEIDQGVVTVVVTVTVWRVAATGTIVRVCVVAPSGV